MNEDAKDAAAHASLLIGGVGRKTKMLAASLLLSSTLLAAEPGAKIGAWSAPVDGMRARLVADTPRESGGEYWERLYLEFEDTAASGVRAIWLKPFREQFVWTLREASGAIVTAGSVFGSSEAGTPAHWITVSAGASTRFEVGPLGVRERYAFETWPARPDEPIERRRGFDVSLGVQVWSIRDNLDAKYFLSARFSSGDASQNALPAPGKIWRGALAIPGIEIRRASKAKPAGAARDGGIPSHILVTLKKAA